MQGNLILILGRVVDIIVASNVVFRGGGFAPHDPIDKNLWYVMVKIDCFTINTFANQTVRIGEGIVI